MGGCQSCRFTDIQPQWSLDFFKNKQQQQQIGLLALKQRKAWQEHLHINGIPQQSFWFDNNQYKHVCFKQIKKDIMRTFPELTFFGNKNNIERFQLLLQKFAVYFPRVGYTQGINFVAGFILLCGFDDNTAFNILVRLCQHDKILALGLYQDQFPLNRFYCQLFWRLLWKKLPKLAEKISRANLSDQMWIFQWFISFFLYSFPIQIMKSFWNFIMIKKQFALVLLALGIVKCMKKDIMSFDDDDQIEYFEYFESLKSFQVFKTKIQMKKILSFSNSITKIQIEQAIKETSCIDNPYQKYFESQNQSIQKQLWVNTITKLQSQRRAYRINPNSIVYQRNRQNIEHLQNFVLKKINKLYNSDVKKSKANFRNSTFSLMKDMSLAYSLPQNNLYGKNTQSIILSQIQIQHTSQQKSKKGSTTKFI